MNILCFGEILWDVYPDKAVIGGAALNFAGHFQKHGGKAYMISAVGDDELGHEAIKVTESFGINTKYISVLKEQTGKCVVTLDSKGVPSYNLLNNVAYDYIGGEVEDKFDALYFGTLALRNEHNRKSLEKLLESNNFSEIFCDVNIRAPFYSAETVTLCAKTATVIKISDEELPIVTKILLGEELPYKSAAEKLAEKYENLRTIIITLGPKGAYVLNAKKGEAFEMEAPKTKVLSTVGAGDSFSAAFMYKYMSGEEIMSALENAIKVSAFVVANLEAIPEYPENF